jgi:ectoine hydroxylase
VSAVIDATERREPYPSRTIARPVWSRRQEPVIHSAKDVRAPISPAMRDSFERSGFMVLKQMFAASEIAALRAELDRLRDDPRDLAPETLVREPGGETALRSVFAIHAQNALFTRLAADARLVRIARYVLGDEVYVHQSRLNYKPGFDGKEFYWHSDFETWRHEDGMARMRAVSMSLLLHDNTPHNGPLLFMPGSHKHFIGCPGATPDEHYKTSLRKQDYGVPDRESLAALAADADVVAATGKAGTLVVFDCNLIHGSNGNITPLPRANAFIVYNAVSNALTAPFGGTAPRPDFIAARGAPKPLRAVTGRLAPGGGA